MSGFPGVQELNAYRTDLFNEEKDSPTTWLGHKAISVVSLPVNGVVIVGGAAAMAVSACTLGVAKVVILFASLGKYENPFSTGIPWMGERTFDSTYHFFVNLGELIRDGFELADKGIDVIRQAMVALKIDHIAKKMFHYVEKAALFIEGRIEKGYTKVKDDEKRALKFFEVPLLDSLNTYSTSEFSKEGYLSILNHQLVSLVNIPTNLVMGSLATAALLGTLGLSAAKVVLVATTGFHIPVPLGVESFARLAGKGLLNTASNAACFVLDYPILLYKVSESLGVTSALSTVAECVGKVWDVILT